ncbi:MAG: hypothetical protein PVH63_13940 [Balneolaceae bacterium]
MGANQGDEGIVFYIVVACKADNAHYFIRRVTGSGRILRYSCGGEGCQ